MRAGIPIQGSAREHSGEFPKLLWLTSCFIGIAFRIQKPIVPPVHLESQGPLLLLSKSQGTLHPIRTVSRMTDMYRRRLLSERKKDYGAASSVMGSGQGQTNRLKGRLRAFQSFVCPDSDPIGRKTPRN